MARLHAGNYVLIHLQKDIKASDTKMTIDDASILPKAPHRLTVEEEIVEVTSISGDTLTIERGKEGTIAANHRKGTEAMNAFTAEMYNDLAGPLTWNQIEGIE